MFLLLSIRTTAQTLGLLNISSCANFAMIEQTVFVSSQQTPSNSAFSSSSSPCARTKYINKIIKTTFLLTIPFSNYLLLLCSKLCRKIAVGNFPIKNPMTRLIFHPKINTNCERSVPRGNFLSSPFNSRSGFSSSILLNSLGSVTKVVVDMGVPKSLLLSEHFS